MKERIKSPYLKIGIAIFISGGALILFYTFVTNLNGVSETLSVINGILSPFIMGLVMAYLLCPIYNLVTRKVYHFQCKNWKNKKLALRFARVIATIVALIVLIGCVGGLMWLVIPELIKSIVGIIQVLPARLTDLSDWVQGTLEGSRYPAVTRTLETAIQKTQDTFVAWAQDKFLPSLGMYMSQITQGVWVGLKTLLNVIIGIIVSVYFLNSKELFRAQIKKTITATMSKEHSDEIIDFANFANRTFGGFINGKIIDSIIMGILCFIVMSVFGLPYAMLVSTIVGVTNFIPFFGPFIGAIPSAIIILLVSPIQAVYFLIIILVLQQLDGNIIGPKILGETVGIASFWVMFSIIVGGGLFGFIGMVLGVPMFAVIYYYFSRYITRRLKKKNMPCKTADYEDYNKYDIDRKDVQ